MSCPVSRAVLAACEALRSAPREQPLPDHLEGRNLGVAARIHPVDAHVRVCVEERGAGETHLWQAQTRTVACEQAEVFLLWRAAQAQHWLAVLVEGVPQAYHWA